MTQRKKGDRYRPIVTIQKIKQGLPTRIEITGNTYVLAHKDQMGWKNGSESNGK